MKIRNSIAEINAIGDVEERLLTLRRSLTYHAKKYYVEDAPEISDYDYDMMYAALLSLESEHPELYDPECSRNRFFSRARWPLWTESAKSITSLWFVLAIFLYLR